MILHVHIGYHLSGYDIMHEDMISYEYITSYPKILYPIDYMILYLIEYTISNIKSRRSPGCCSSPTIRRGNFSNLLQDAVRRFEVLNLCPSGPLRQI